MTRYLIALGVLAAALVATWLHGNSRGSAAVQAQWDQAEAQRVRQVAIHAAQEVRRQAAITDTYTARQSEQLGHLAKLRAELRQALRRPLQCPKPQGDTHAPELADLLVPADAVDRLRRAGAGPGSP